MAFGALHPRVFTGRDAISVLVALVTQIVDGTAAEADGEISRTDAAAIAERLMTDHWTFAPLPEQTRKMKSVSPLVSVTCEETIESPTPSTKPRSSTGVSDLFDLVTSAAKTSVNPSTWSMFDDETTLYRLTRDTLLQRDFNASYFNDFLATVSDGEKGLEFREGKILFRRIGVEDRVFSQASWNRWFDQRLGMDQKQSSAVLKLFLERRAVEKVSMSSCYRFV